MFLWNPLRRKTCSIANFGIKEKAQSTIEYALLIAVVAAAFIAMQVYMQRAVQANFKLMEEQVNVAP